MSIAWLRTDDLAMMFVKGQAVRPRRPVDEGQDLLSTVVLSLAARNRLTLYAVSHGPGVISRFLGKSGDTVIHVVAAGLPSGDEGAVEKKLLDAVTCGTGSKAPHGLPLNEAVGLIFPSSVSSPAGDLLQWAKEDAVARGVGRWIRKEEVPPPPPESGGLLYEMALVMAASQQLYQILPANERAADAVRASLDEFRLTLAARDAAVVSTIEHAVVRGIDSRVSRLAADS